MDIKDNLQDIFRDVFDDETIVIDDKTTADDIDSWDSLTHLQLIMTTEMEFGIKFSTDEVKSMVNVGEMIKIIEEKL